MNYELIVRVALDLVIISIGLYLVFWKGYLNEKGKNYATKEDIGEITKEIEIVKNEIIYTVQRKSEFIRESKDIALSFFDLATFYIDYSSKITDILVNNQSNLDIILKQIEDTRLQVAKVTSSFLKIFIYYDESSFTKSATDYYDAIVKIHELYRLVLLQLEQNAFKENSLMSLFNDGHLQVKDDLLSIKKASNELLMGHAQKLKKLLDDEVYTVRGLYIVELSKIIKINEND